MRPPRKVATLETLAENGTNVQTKTSGDNSGDTSGDDKPAATKQKEEPRGASSGETPTPQPPATSLPNGAGTSSTKGAAAFPPTKELRPSSDSNISISETVAAVQAAARRGSAEAAAEAASAAVAAAVAVQAAVAAAAGEGEGAELGTETGTGAGAEAGGEPARSAYLSSLETLGSLTGQVYFRSIKYFFWRWEEEGV